MSSGIFNLSKPSHTNVTQELLYGNWVRQLYVAPFMLHLILLKKIVQNVMMMQATDILCCDDNQFLV